MPEATDLDPCAEEFAAWYPTTREPLVITMTEMMRGFRAGWNACARRAQAAIGDAAKSVQTSNASAPEFRLSTRARRVLEREQIAGPEALSQYSRIEIAIMRGVGPTIQHELLNWLAWHGLTTRDGHPLGCTCALCRVDS